MNQFAKRFMRTVMTWIGRLFVRTIYRLQVVNHEAIPKRGAAILVFNHVSYADPIIRVAALQRPIRFLIWKGHYESWILRAIGEVFESFPVSGELSPGQLVQVMRQIKKALREGDLVGISAEGMVSELGFMLPFRRGIEVMMRLSPEVPVIPVHIDGMWGSVFTNHQRRFLWRYPNDLRRHISLVFGEPITRKPSANYIRRKIQILGVEACCLRRSHGRNLGREFIRQAIRSPHSPCFAQGDDRSCTYRQAFSLALRIAHLVIAKRPKPDAITVSSNQAEELILACLTAAISNVGVVVPSVSDEEQQDPTTEGTLDSRAEEKEIAANCVGLNDLCNTGSGGPMSNFRRLAWTPTMIASALQLPVRTQYRSLGSKAYEFRAQGVSLASYSVTPDDLLSNAQALYETLDLSVNHRVRSEVSTRHPLAVQMLWACLLSGACIEFGDEDENGHHLTFDVVDKSLFDKQDRGKCGSRITIVSDDGSHSFEEQLDGFGRDEMLGWWVAELGSVVTMNRPDAPGQIGHRPGTVGHPLPGTVLRVMDARTDCEVKEGNVGIIDVQNVFTRMNHTSMGSVWFRTKRSGFVDSNGFLTLVGQSQ